MHPPEEDDTKGPAPDAEKKDDSAKADDSASEACADSEELTPEEQMARYEDSLKDTDWGHQPC